MVTLLIKLAYTKVENKLAETVSVGRWNLIKTKQQPLKPSLLIILERGLFWMKPGELPLGTGEMEVPLF